MNCTRDYYPESPEPLIVNLARSGDRLAFAELVRRHQSNIRNLMRRCCRNEQLADDLAQETFFRAWISIRSLKDARAFSAWLKRIAVSMWLRHLRKHDILLQSDKLLDVDLSEKPAPGVAMDLDTALATLAEPVRLCIILSYQAGMTHREIEDSTGIPLGTIKSHIKRGSAQLKKTLQPYREESTGDYSK